MRNVSSVPATRYSHRIDTRNSDADLGHVIEICSALRAADPTLDGWINFPIVNETGDAADGTLRQYRGQSRPTSYATRLPWIASVVENLASEGLGVRYARVAVLGQRDLLRTHMDSFQSRRLLIPLTEQGDAFRHLYGDVCFVMRAGEIWEGDGGVCHGAANVASTGWRVLLLIDVDQQGREKSSPDWLADRWEIPDASIVRLPPWTNETRRERFVAARSLMERDGRRAAEREMLLLPFEFAMPADYVYREMLCFARWMGRLAVREDVKTEWYAQARSIAHPTAPCAVKPPRYSLRSSGPQPLIPQPS